MDEIAKEYDVIVLGTGTGPKLLAPSGSLSWMTLTNCQA